MKAPKCRLCHKEHYGTCSSSDLPEGPDEVMEGAAKRLATGPENQSNREVRGSTPPPSATAPSSSGRTAVLGPANGGSNPSGVAKERFKKGGSEARLYRSIGLPPSESCLNDPDVVYAAGYKAALTPAERQRNYRERLKADPAKWKEYLEADRERKRK